MRIMCREGEDSHCMAEKLLTVALDGGVFLSGLTETHGHTCVYLCVCESVGIFTLLLL